MSLQAHSQMSSAELAVLAEKKRAELLGTKHNLGERLTVANVASEVTDAGADALKSAGKAVAHRPVTSSAIALSAAALGIAWMTGFGSRRGRTSGDGSRRSNRHTSGRRAISADDPAQAGRRGETDQTELWPRDEAAPASPRNEQGNITGSGNAPLHRNSFHRSAGHDSSAFDDLLYVLPRLGLAVAAGYVAEKFIPRVEGEDALWKEVGSTVNTSVQGGAVGLMERFAKSPSNPLPLLTIAAVALQAFSGDKSRASRQRP